MAAGCDRPNSPAPRLTFKLRAGNLAKRPLGASREEREMSWTAPKIVEVALGGEINCYACARVK